MQERQLQLAIIIILFLLAASIILNTILLASRFKPDTPVLEANRLNRIYPFLLNLDEEQFAQNQKYYRVEFKELKIEINNSVILPQNAEYAVYFESLNNGAYIGINEKEPYAPGSLRKIPLLGALYKKIEAGEISKSDYVQILPQEVDPAGGPLGARGSGVNVSISELINYTTFYSDNTAAIALYRTVGTESYVETMFNMGLSLKTYLKNMENTDEPMSAKEYSNVMRSLYYANWLTREDSQEILQLLSKTSFNEGIPRGVPPGVAVAHKTAYWISGSQHHDCGIVYYPKSPYILCIMIVGLNQSSADQVSEKISRIAYNYVDQLTKK